MSKNKKKWSKKNSETNAPTQPTSFKSFEECLHWIKKWGKDNYLKKLAIKYPKDNRI